MSNGGAVVSEVESLRAELAALKASHEALEGRVLELEAGLDQERRLHRRVAELTDLVQQTLLPAPQRNDKAIARHLERYTSQL